MGKMISSILLSIILAFLIMTICCLSKNNNVTFDCVSGEKKSLMRFKASFSDVDPSKKRLSSWKANTECCGWEGVERDNATGHVVQLDLRNRDMVDGLYPSRGSMLRSDKIDSSLLELKYLSYLDLSGNDFNGSSIPKFLGSMKQLQYLNLSNADFSGIVPHQLGNLSSLHALDLGGESYGSLIADDVTTWTGNLWSLEYLDMSGIDLSGTKNLIKVLTTLPSLVDLRLSNTGLNDTHLPHANCVNKSTLLFTNVQHLDLSMNSFGENSSFFLHNMTSLSFLDLSNNLILQKADWISDFVGDKCHLKSLNLGYNIFYGDISGAFKNLSSGCWGRNLESINFRNNEFDGHLPEELGHELKQLRELDVSQNNLSGPIPFSLGNLRALQELDVSQNKLYGPIPSSIGNLRALRMLCIYSNQLGGEIPVSLGQLSNLESVDMHDNKLSGLIPFSIGNLRALRVLLLSSNKLSGEIPISLGQLSNLENIDVDDNSFQSTLSEAHFANLSRIETLSFTGSNNGIKFCVGDDWVPPFQLRTLWMESVEIIESGQFPKWIQTQKSLEYLVLSNCSIRGTLPAWLIGSLKNLTTLDLSNNHIQGPIIPQLPTNLKYLDLSRNLIDGSIPESLMCQIKGVLGSLDLSRNHLSGHLPDCNWDYKLDFARLSYNQLSGPIPNSIAGGGDYCWLEWLQLNNNNFTGQIPFSLHNCTYLSFLDIGDNMLSGKLPLGIGNHLLEYLGVLRLRNNQFDGDIPSSFCQLSQLQIMDLAHNRLAGYIPRCFGNLSGMINAGGGFNGIVGLTLNEVMKGAMLEYTSSTSQFLVNLDLSSNRLFGEIPSELTNLIGLNGLNLSHNHLRGTIPPRIGDMKSLESFDLSSNSLSGTIPQSISKLTSLSYLNLSNNDLSGPIPTGPQLQTFNNPSSYDGNHGLCGDPLPKKCGGIIDNGIPLRSRKVENDDGDKLLTDKIYLYAFISSGLATGFWGYFGVLVLKRSWRRALFQRMEVVIAKMLGRY